MNMDLNITSDCLRIDFACITSQDDAPSGDIAFAAGTSVLGAVLAARSAHGICAVLIGSEAEELTADLAERFPKNTLSGMTGSWKATSRRFSASSKHRREDSISNSMSTARRSSGGYGMLCAEFQPGAP